ncbi:MAG TPA: response regulator [Thermoleophilia bacterium]|nr:response regulator [Thermoleophilia bacterium]
MDTEHAASSSAQPRSSAVILVAEDDPDIMSLVRHVLESEGYVTCAARDGREAIDLYVEIKPDLFVLDVMMPRHSGLEVLRELGDRGQRRQDVPVLMLTSRASEDDVMAGFDLGVDDYLTKPFMVGELRARVRTLLARRDRRV